MALIAQRLEEARETWGGESILPYSYGGSNGLLTQDTSDATLFRRLGASRLARTVCAAPTGAANEALYGKMPSITYEDYPAARLIIMWGVNPSASGIHLVPYIREAQRNGATLIVIDPRTTALAKQADIHLAIRPGTDLPVALSIHRFLFEEGLADRAVPRRAHAPRRAAARQSPPVDVRTRRGRSRRVRRRTRDGGPAVRGGEPALIRCGWGQERNRNGGNSSPGDPGAAGGGRKVRRPRRRLRDEQHRGMGHRAHLDRRAGARDSPRST